MGTALRGLAQDWTYQEIREVVLSYFQMLQWELGGQTYNKSAERRKLLPKLNGRSHSSVEFKHQNISAVLIRHGQPYIQGYKPAYNYQQALEAAVLEFLRGQDQLLRAFQDFALEPPSQAGIEPDFENWLEPQPKSEGQAEEKPTWLRGPRFINFLELEQRNADLGRDGEAMVVDYEKWRLKRAGKPGLARKVVWTSQEEGDGAGYDIASHDAEGDPIYIEVKTTKLGKDTPIYLSRNEVGFSQENALHFHLYRLYDFRRQPRMFIARGPLDQVCSLEPNSYIGRFR